MLLKNVFNFLDVNDAGAVNKILDEASSNHVMRAQKRNPLRSEVKTNITKEKELAENLSLAMN
jgi:hypothetical protein